MSPDREPGDRAFWETPEQAPPAVPPPSAAPGGASEAEETREHPIVAWARAIAMGARDTARDVLDEGRGGARAKQAQMWEKFDRKTRRRRNRE